MWFFIRDLCLTSALWHSALLHWKKSQITVYHICNNAVIYSSLGSNSELAVCLFFTAGECLMTAINMYNNVHKCALFILCFPSSGHQTLKKKKKKLPLNNLMCLFLDAEPPVIDRCRSPPTVQATDTETETAVVWEVPQFSDNSGMSSRRSQMAAPWMVYSFAPLFHTTPPSSSTDDG